jgi:colicin import membrane protein
LMQRADPAYYATPFAHTRWDLLASMVSTVPASVPRQARRWALWASLAAHGVMVAGLVFSVSWKSSPPAALQAELWDAVPGVAVPAAEPLPAESTPEVKPELKPAPVAPPPAPEPDVIAPKVVKPPKEIPKVPPKPEAKPEKTAKELAKEAAKDKAKEQAKLNQTKEAERAKETARLNALAGTAGGAPKVGTPQVGAVTGLGSNWGAKLKACVQPHMRFSDANAGNPKVELAVQLLPSGTPVGVRTVKSSGNALFDAAVERAIMRCDPFPRPESGGLPNSLNVIYRLNEG